MNSPLNLAATDDKGPEALVADRGRKGSEQMKFSVRKANGKTRIRLQIGALAITVEFPL